MHDWKCILLSAKPMSTSHMTLFGFVVRYEQPKEQLYDYTTVVFNIVSEARKA